MKTSLKLLLLLAGLLAQPAGAASERVLLVVGDSLSAGYNMPLDQAWPSLLQARLQNEGHDYRVVNASITGDTTQGGRARLPRLLQRHNPDIVIIELGGNDGLRGFGLELTRNNLVAMIEASRAAGAEVLLVGILLPPNYGLTYTERFRDLFPELATALNVPLLPFLLEGVALDEALMQADGIHPEAAAQPRIRDNVWRVLAPMLTVEPALSE